jgi:hypothetical protein
MIIAFISLSLNINFEYAFLNTLIACRRKCLSRRKRSLACNRIADPLQQLSEDPPQRSITFESG